jgi:thymidylate synthase
MQLHQDIDSSYLNLLAKALNEGEREDPKLNRTGVGTRYLNSETLSVDLDNGYFPLLSTKTIPAKLPLGELCWMLSGSSNERDLCEILYGTRDPSKRTFWTDNAESLYWKISPHYNEEDPYNLGNVYGKLWRYWPGKEDGQYIDQIYNLVEGLIHNPRARKHVLSFWNPEVVQNNSCALPPCHYTATFSVSPESKRLNTTMVMRSADLFLGVPFNLVFYAGLVHLLCHAINRYTGITPGRLTVLMVDCHLYENHVDQALLQISRHSPNITKPRLRINSNFSWDYRLAPPLSVFTVENYSPMGVISAPMAV